ncbi:MAG: zinc ribbon domain-containing protein [Nitrospira sp.]|nr:MAG: zinc ribbon domain-containing protein [Nitrospira sp.]
MSPEDLSEWGRRSRSWRKRVEVAATIRGRKPVPIYEYQCDGCSYRFEVKQSIKDDPLSTCERCGKAIRRLISSPGIMFKGSGWYVTDYSDKLKPPSSTGSETGGTSSGEKSSGEKNAGEKKEPAAAAPSSPAPSSTVTPTAASSSSSTSTPSTTTPSPSK